MTDKELFYIVSYDGYWWIGRRYNYGDEFKVKVEVNSEIINSISIYLVIEFYDEEQDLVIAKSFADNQALYETTFPKELL